MSRGPWIEALDRQAALADGLARSAWPRAVVEAFVSTLPDPPIAYDAAMRPISVADWLATVLPEAETYWVSAEMLDVVSAAAGSMPDEILIPEDLPSTSGFAYLERSVFVRDRRGQQVSFRAISWEQVNRVERGNVATRAIAEVAAFDDPNTVFAPPTGELTGEPVGVVYTLWVDVEEPDDAINVRLAESPMRKLGGRLQMMHYAWQPFGEGLDSAWFDHEPDATDDDPHAEPRLPAAEQEAQARQSIMWRLAFWRLMQQRVARETVEQPDRATARRIARTPRFRSDPFVRVIRLRQYSDAQPAIDGDREGVRWSHRWVVGGHWRNQWYASLGRHRAIWISPFVKGPPDQPLVIKPTVRTWVR